LDPFSSPGLREAFLFMLPSYLIITPLLHLHITDTWAGEQTGVALLGTIRGYVNHFRVTTTSSLINVSSRQTAVKGEASPEKTHLSHGAVPFGRGRIAISCQICGKVPMVGVPGRRNSGSSLVDFSMPQATRQRSCRIEEKHRSE